MANKNSDTHSYVEHSKYGELLSTILSRLDVAVFLWDGRTFVKFSELPVWFTDLYQTNTSEMTLSGDSFRLGDAFPFIENFIVDAEVVWNKQANTQLRSGIWTECPDEFTEYNLEARAMWCNGHAFLLIVNETKHFDIRRKVFQKARDMALKNERLESSLSLHQRQLQLQIEDIYKQHHSFEPIKQRLNHDSTAVLICKQDGSVELVNKALVDIYEVAKDNQMSQRSLLKKWHEEAEQQYPEISRVLASGQHWEGEFETRDSNQKKKWVRLMIAPILGEDNKPEHFVCLANDISNIKLSEREIELLIQLDPNTHLPNRRYFWSHLADLIASNEQTGDTLSVMYIDLDRFKQVNDELGPEQGDVLLKAIANRLRQCIKKNDFIAHLGGDEFAVIINHITDEVSLSTIADRIQNNLKRDLVFDGLALNISVSIGIASYPVHGLKPHVLVKNADYAMFHAKQMGGNQFQFSNPYSHRRIKRKIQIEQGLKNAIKREEFCMLYQPQMSLTREGEHRVEALIRWQHPDHGMVTPGDFISIAEESGLIVDIGRWVLTTACTEAARLNRLGLNAKVSINVSPKQFQNGTLFTDVSEALSNCKVFPEQLELEVTESLFLHNLEDIKNQLNQIKGLGVSVALDDFGTGFSSLNYLKRLPIDVLKIDRSFIKELPDNLHSRTIVESVISMSHQLSIEVVAEGIEHRKQLDYLRQLNCDYVQGYLFHAPLTSDELTHLYRSFKPAAGNKKKN